MFAVDPIRYLATRRDIGRRFRFAEDFDAAAFRLFCCKRPGIADTIQPVIGGSQHSAHQRTRFNPARCSRASRPTSVASSTRVQIMCPRSRAPSETRLPGGHIRARNLAMDADAGEGGLTSPGGADALVAAATVDIHVDSYSKKECRDHKGG